jgi:hypothetical protein
MPMKQMLSTGAAAIGIFAALRSPMHNRYRPRRNGRRHCLLGRSTAQR